MNGKSETRGLAVLGSTGSIGTQALEVVERGRGAASVLVPGDGKLPPQRRPVKIGLSNGERVEIVSGMGPEDRVLAVDRRGPAATSRASGGSPFMSTRRR